MKFWNIFWHQVIRKTFLDRSQTFCDVMGVQRNTWAIRLLSLLPYCAFFMTVVGRRSGRVTSLTSRDHSSLILGLPPRAPRSPPTLTQDRTQPHHQEKSVIPHDPHATINDRFYAPGALLHAGRHSHPLQDFHHLVLQAALPSPPPPQRTARREAGQPGHRRRLLATASAVLCLGRRMLGSTPWN